jgi:hypothetical protein
MFFSASGGNRCERAFSKLKIVKTRLRSLLSNELLETFMLMSIEKDLLSEISMDDIIGTCAFFNVCTYYYNSQNSVTYKAQIS